jgi:hypothetical protein
MKGKKKGKSVWKVGKLKNGCLGPFHFLVDDFGMFSFSGVERMVR